jgi:hypothetical protein
MMLDAHVANVGAKRANAEAALLSEAIGPGDRVGLQGLVSQLS